jgi:hypothetical protein
VVALCSDGGEEEKVADWAEVVVCDGFCCGWSGSHAEISVTRKTQENVRVQKRRMEKSFAMRIEDALYLCVWCLPGAWSARHQQGKLTFGPLSTHVISHLEDHKPAYGWMEASYLTTKALSMR